jgi:hypothetical protein
VSELERRLVAAGPHWFPETPDVVGPALTRLPERRPRTRARLAVALATAVALVGAAVLAFSPGARSAVLDVLDRVPGLHIERRESLPEVGFRDTPYYGLEVDDREEAEERFGGPLRFPDGFDDPDRLYWLIDQPGDMITAIYGDEERAELVFSQWHTSGSDLFQKVLSFNTEARPVVVNGGAGLWLYGADHGVWYLRPGETRLSIEADEFRTDGHLAGNTLVWRDGDLAYRLEADIPLERALELARSSLPAER